MIPCLQLFGIFAGMVCFVMLVQWWGNMMAEGLITGRVVFARCAVGGRWNIMLGIETSPNNIIEEYVSVLEFPPDVDPRKVQFDGEVVKSGSELLQRLNDAKGIVTVTIHPNKHSYIPNAQAEFVTATEVKP